MTFLKHYLFAIISLDMLDCLWQTYLSLILDNENSDQGYKHYFPNNLQMIVLS